MCKHYVVVAAMWMGLGASLCWGAAGPQSPATQEAGPAPATASAPAVLALDPAKYLADPPDRQSALRQERRAVEEVLAADGEDLDKAQAHLAVANWLLAMSPARPATRWLIGVQTAADLEGITASAKEARGHLDRARSLLESEAVKALRGQGKTRRRELAKAAEVLKSFAGVLAAAATPADTQDGQSAWVEAAIGLSAARESDRDDVAAAALLWQSFAWERAGRRDRALESLPDALTPPKQLPYDFFCRILRCRILADDGQHTAALVLTTRMLDASRKWFATQPRPALDALMRPVALLQYRVSLAWMDRFEANAEATGSADAIRTALADRQRELFGDGRETVEVYCLEGAIPILLEARPSEQLAPDTAPATTVPASGPASAPATTPDRDEIPPTRGQRAGS